MCLCHSDSQLLCDLWPNGRCVYLDDLLAMSRNRPDWPIPTHLGAVEIPLEANNWRLHLSNMPDKEFTSFVLQGILQGFQIGFIHRRVTLKAAKSNMVSTREHSQVIAEYLQDKCEEGVIGSLGDEAAQEVKQISQFGVIPEGHSPGKWRLIVDLSTPTDHGVNDGIPCDLCSLEYTSVDRAAAIISRLGQGCQLAKLDIKSVYRNIPVHPDNRPLLSMRWRGETYVDTALPFGLRSAPKIFNVLVDGLT